MKSEELAKIVREDVVEMAYLSKGSHVASALSIVDILAVLYNDILNVNPKNLKDKHRDRLILSKGHAGSALYSTLARKGFFNPAELKNHYQNGSKLSGHISHKVPGIEFSTGSLGHGLPLATGLALNAKIDKEDYKVYVIIGDGECDEGSNWEAIMFAAHHKLNNLTVIIDKNKLQAMGECSTIINLESYAEKFKVFGYETIEIDGHNHNQLRKALKQETIDKPKCIICNTIKGYGVSFMENNILWHYHNPNEEEYKAAIAEIRGEN